MKSRQNTPKGPKKGAAPAAEEGAIEDTTMKHTFPASASKATGNQSV
jgi:hypothetical protein